MKSYNFPEIEVQLAGVHPLADHPILHHAHASPHLDANLTSVHSSSQWRLQRALPLFFYPVMQELGLALPEVSSTHLSVIVRKS